MAFRNPGEPASRPFCYPALAAAQVVGAGSTQAVGPTLITIIAANKGASAANLTVTDNSGEIGSLQIPAGDTETIFSEPGITFVGQLTVTPSAALDVTVVVV
mgnify:CR=1 FL=1